jgi:hypothetical protein
MSRSNSSASAAHPRRDVEAPAADDVVEEVDGEGGHHAASSGRSAPASRAAIRATCAPWKRAPARSVCGGRAGSVGPGDGARAIGRAADDALGRRLAGEGVGHAGDQHPEMLQRDLGGQQRRLVPAMLRAGGGEDGRDLAHQRVPRPEPARLVEEGFHLPGHHAEEGRRAEDDGVVGFEIGRRRDGRVVLDKAAFCRISSGTVSGTRRMSTWVPGRCVRLRPRPRQARGHGRSWNSKERERGSWDPLRHWVSMPGRIGGSVGSE